MSENNNQPGQHPNTGSQQQPEMQFGNFLTSSDLKALEQRLEVLVSKELEQSMAANFPIGPAPDLESSFEIESPGLVQPSNTTKKISITSLMKR